MCNGTWVCFDCRKAVRRRTWRLVTYLRPWLIGSVDVGPVTCPACRAVCQFLGPTIEIPSRGKVHAWEDLRESVALRHARAVESRVEDSVRQRHDLEQPIRDLESRPQNAGRDELIKRLQAALAA